MAELIASVVETGNVDAVSDLPEFLIVQELALQEWLDLI